jgi:DNA ligase-1
MTLFATLAQLADTLAAEPARLKKRAAIAVTLQQTAATSIEDAGLLALYLSGEPFPESDARKLNVGGALLTRALTTVSRCTEAALTAAYRKHGDLGAAAYDLLLSTAPTTPTLTLTDIATSFATITTAPTTAARFALVEGLLLRATALDAKYLLKLMLADMRIGVKQALIEEAIAIAASAELPAVRNAVMLEADLSHATARAFAGTLAEARMALFHPLGFMLASPVDTPEEAIERFTAPTPKAGVAAGFSPRNEANREGASAPEALPQAPIHAYLEDKYDGMRCQLHCGDPAHPGRVALYSRNREDITPSFPEIAEAFAHITEPIILDGELLGWDLAADQALPFSILGQRIGRKRVTNDLRRTIPVIFMAFDLLYQQDELLLTLPLSARRARLEALTTRLTPSTASPLELDPHATSAQGHLFVTNAGAPHLASEMWEESPTKPIPRLHLSPAIMVTSAQAIDEAYAAARARANEGVMLKSATSAYQPGRRGLSWVKLKRELATLDVVITAAEFGHGRRAGLLSDYTFAVRSPNGDLLNVGKAYSGLTDAEIAELTAWLQSHTLEDHGHARTVEPLRVLEVAFNNVMRSDRHPSGFALRFPRILRIRDDKPPTEIDTLARVEEIYHSQPDKA